MKRLPAIPEPVRNVLSEFADFAALADHRAALLCGALVLLRAHGAAADTDCTQRTDARSDPKWSCVAASSFGGSCIPRAAFDKWSCLELDQDARLCADGGTYNMTVYLAHSGVQLDCADQVIDHGYSTGQPRRPGMRTPYTYSVSDVVVRNCHIRNVGRYGIDLKRLFRGDQLAGAMQGHRGIRIDHVSILHARQWGIYVGQNSRDIAIRRASIDDAYGGVYLEAGSSGTHIAQASIVNSRVREGLAIDSSANNTVEGSRFEGNSVAINIYTNCGETGGQVCPIARTMDADGNVLEGNTFHRDDVRVALRQYKLYGLGFCQDMGVAGYWRDRAAWTVLERNRFDGAVLEVDDGPVLVHDNLFSARATLELGSLRPPFFWDSAVAIAGLVAGNVFESGATIQYDSRGIYGQLYVVGNRDGDGLCLGHNRCARSGTDPLRSATTPPPWVNLVKSAKVLFRRSTRGGGDSGWPGNLQLDTRDVAAPPRPQFRRALRIFPNRHTPRCTGCR